MLDPTPITSRFHGSSLAATLLGSAAYFLWPSQGTHLALAGAAYMAAFLGVVKFIHAAWAGTQLVFHRGLKKRAKKAA